MKNDDYFCPMPMKWNDIYTSLIGVSFEASFRIFPAFTDREISRDFEVLAKIMAIRFPHK